MSRYSLTRLAGEDVNGIWDYIGIEQQQPESARRVIDSLYKVFTSLAAFPYLGTAVEDLADILPGIRMFPESPYKVYYLPTDVGIRVLRVVHSKQYHLHLAFRQDSQPPNST